MLTLFVVPVSAQDPPLAPTPPIDAPVRDVGTIRPFDLVILSVYQRGDLSGSFAIDAHGFVDIPGLGRYRVAGLTPPQLRERLTTAFQEIVDNPAFSVNVQIRVYVLGEVRTPKMHLVEPGTTLLAIIAVADGETTEADLKRTTVLRDGKTYTVDLEAGRRGGHQGGYSLYSNDYVIVPEKRGWTRETLSFVMSGVTVALAILNILIALERTKQ